MLMTVTLPSQGQQNRINCRYFLHAIVNAYELKDKILVHKIYYKQDVLKMNSYYSLNE